MSWNDLRKGRFSHTDYSYFITCTLHNRTPLFSNAACAQIMKCQLEHLQGEQKLSWQAWVIMPDHIHGLFSLESNSLSMAMKLLKGRSARELNILLGKSGPVWQPGFYDHGLRKDEAIAPIADYVIYNPVRAGLVDKPEQWLWWFRM